MLTPEYRATLAESGRSDKVCGRTRRLTSPSVSRSMLVMLRRMKTAVLSVLLALLCSNAAGAAETAPRISDREIVENTAPSAQFPADVQTQFQHREQQGMPARFDDANAQLDRQYRLMFWMLGAIVTAFVSTLVGYAWWERQHFRRLFESKEKPFEGKAVTIEDELARNRYKLHALLEALRPLARTNEQLAAVLRQHRLL